MKENIDGNIDIGKIYEHICSTVYVVQYMLYSRQEHEIMTLS